MFEWLQENVLFCGMVGSGVFGLLCLVMINHFYNKVWRDVQQMKTAKGKWTKEFLSEYQNRMKNQQEIKNEEVFVRAQLINGKILGVALQKWKQGVGWGTTLCLFLLLVAVYNNYSSFRQLEQLLPCLWVGTIVTLFLFMRRQFTGVWKQEDMLVIGLLDYLENTNPISDHVVDMISAREQIREELIQRVTEGISQTAASQNKFSHMLTAEEEKIVREVIREYLT